MNLTTAIRIPAVVLCVNMLSLVLSISALVIVHSNAHLQTPQEIAAAAHDPDAAPPGAQPWDMIVDNQGHWTFVMPDGDRATMTTRWSFTEASKMRDGVLLTYYRGHQSFLDIHGHQVPYPGNP